MKRETLKMRPCGGGLVKPMQASRYGDSKTVNSPAYKLAGEMAALSNDSLAERNRDQDEDTESAVGNATRLSKRKAKT